MKEPPSPNETLFNQFQRQERELSTLLIRIRCCLTRWNNPVLRVSLSKVLQRESVLIIQEIDEHLLKR